MRPAHMIAALLALAACEKPAQKAETPAKAPEASAEKGPVGFRHDPLFDPQGYYMPASPVKVGTLELDHLGMGAPSDFATWESGDRAAVFGPILMQFDDTASPMVVDEIGEHRAVTLRVLPAAYEVSTEKVRFAGADGRLGQISFEGAFAPGALAAVKGGERVETKVLVGDLRIGQAVFPKVAFTYFAGD